MAEIDVEEKYCELAAAKYGLWPIKFKHVGIKGAPDRQVMCPNNHTFYIEFKIGKNSASEHQLKFARTLSKLGFRTYFCYTVKEAMDATAIEMEYANSQRPYRP
jgi:hypothetical protein